MWVIHLPLLFCKGLLCFRVSLQGHIFILIGCNTNRQHANTSIIPANSIYKDLASAFTRKYSDKVCNSLQDFEKLNCL